MSGDNSNTISLCTQEMHVCIPHFSLAQTRCVSQHKLTNQRIQKVSSQMLYPTEGPACTLVYLWQKRDITHHRSASVVSLFLRLFVFGLCSDSMACVSVTKSPQQNYTFSITPSHVYSVFNLILSMCVRIICSWVVTKCNKVSC